MAKANDTNTPEQQPGDNDWRTDGTEAEQGRHAADGGGLRERAERQTEVREQFRAAEDYAPPAGEGAEVKPDAQRNDPDGEAKPTA